jgi:hypothetical protein
MEKTTTISTVISSDVKRAAVLYCKKHGLKLRYLVESALIDQLEDEIDLEAFRKRRDEECFSLDQVISKPARRKKK